MNPLKSIAIALLVAGALALLYGGFTYTKKTHKTEIGPITFAVKEKEPVNVPVWAGVAAIVVCWALLFARPKG